MMNLSDAVGVFNKTSFTDIDGDNSFLAQVLPFEDNVRSGPTSRRHILEVMPSVTVPDVVIDTTSDQVYLVAFGSSDSFLGDKIRNKYPIIASESSYTLLSLYDLLAETSVDTIRACVNYARREPSEDSINNFGGFLGIIPQSEYALAGMIIYTGSLYYRVVEDSYQDYIGIPTFEAIRMPDAIKTLDVTSGQTYDPVDEVYTGGTVSALRCVVEAREKSFDMLREDASDIETGDVTISTLHTFLDDDILEGYDILSVKVVDAVSIVHGRVK